MKYRLQREITRLKKDIINLGANVEEQLENGVRALEENDKEQALKIIDKDVLIDEMEIDLEESCLKLLALHQPVAIDLRFIIATLKINNDLERIGDLVVNICERGVYLSALPDPPINFDFPAMYEVVRKMLKMSLDSLVNLDSNAAREVCFMDDEVDEMNRNMYRIVSKEMELDKPAVNANQLLHLLSVSRHLERIADLATNIAEDVIYMIEGRIVRHKVEEY